MTNAVDEFPSSAAHAGDPPPLLAELRKRDPVSRVRLPGGEIAWLITRHEDVRQVLADPTFTRNLEGGGAVRPNTHDPRGEVFGTAIRTLSMDGQPHAELRRLVSKALTARRVQAMRPRIQDLTDGLLDSMEARGAPADLVVCLAQPLPAIVICELVGVPAGEREQFRVWSDHITSVGRYEPDMVASAWRRFSEYIGDLIAVKRRDPADDLLTALIEARDNQHKLSDEELRSLTIVILAGGLETTAVAISAGLVRLFRHADQLARLRAEPDLMGSAVEELLRFQPIIDLNRLRIATRDARVGGVLIRAGEPVQISITSANRDEDAFARGAEFDVSRSPNAHLAFGHGAHFCLGSALAMVELTTVFTTLLRRYPGLRIAVPLAELTWRAGQMTVGPERLPVAW
ncbi:MAG: cytochrome P450 [Kutzneria sp.]|nr:cytochrome P450 [Kutzneria sp.]MBV9844782.1 cytochrome P450 [Kutzneria sp.]